MCKKLKGCQNRIDKCMINLINSLEWSLSSFWKTVACCCGHKKYPMTVVIQNEDGYHHEIFHDIDIPRKRNLYKKDKEGIYFIPEVLEKLESKQ